MSIKAILSLYQLSVRRFPVLKYSWGIVAAICILAFISYFHVENVQVPFKSILYVIALIFIIFLLTFITNVQDRIILIALYALIYALIVATISFILGFGFYIYFGKPKFYDRIFDVTATKQISDNNSTFDFITLTSGPNGEIQDYDTLTAKYIVQDLGNDIKLELVKIPGNSFNMGTSVNEIEEYGLRDELTKWVKVTRPDMVNEYDSLPFSETPKHIVTLNDFYIGKYEITQKQWRQVARLPMVNYPIPENPSSHLGENKPVENISFRAAMEFCARLYKLTGKKYTLPSESQWEYACRAGTSSQFCFGENIQASYVNFNSKYQFGSGPRGINRNTTLDVGQLKYANRFGIYDMSGNVWEWCLDRWHKNYEGAPADGSAWLKGGLSEYRVVRGGSWEWWGYGCRSSYRNYREESETIAIKNGKDNGSHGLRIVL